MKQQINQSEKSQEAYHVNMRLSLSTVFFFAYCLIRE